MKFGLRNARLSAAIIAVLYGASAAHARSLTWDASGANPPTDGSGNWDLSSSNWFDPTVPGVTTWSDANPDSATFGTGPTVPPTTAGAFNILLNANITVQNINLGTASNGGFYDIADQGDGNQTLTLAGNINKTSGAGNPVFQLTNALALTAGNHVVSLNDTSGDAPPELTMNNGLTGAGSLTLDNGFNSSGYAQWGTLVLNLDSNYTGGTNVVKGRLVANTSNALGTGPVVISNQGNLAFGGAGTSPVGNLTITNAVTITRNTYAGTDFNDYADAITSNNTGNSGEVVTFSGPFTVDSTDARVSANTSTIVISSNIQQGADVTGGVLTVDGDFAGFITLSGNNTALKGGIQLIGGVELNVSNQNNLGGASSPLTFAGSATLHPVGGFMTGFGTHVLNNATFSGGIDVDSGQTFNIDQALGDSTNKGGSLGKRGLGTLNINSPVNLQGGQTFFDAGIVNVNNTATFGSLHLRSPVVNIGTGGSVTTTNGYDSLGQDSTGTNGGPDMATINLTGTGALIQSSGDDFNLSDNANTTGTINMYDNSVLTTGGITFLGKSSGANGTINQHGGTFTVNRGGNFGFVISDGRGGTSTGNYNFSGGTFSAPSGEVYVGEGTNGNGTWNQTGGTATLGNWFVVGREGALGTVNISGGTFTRTDGSGNIGDENGTQSSIGEGSNKLCAVTISGTGQMHINTGELWVGNNSGNGVVNVGTAAGALTNADATASLTVNNWFAVGRSGNSTGVLNLYDGTVTQALNAYLDVSGDGGSSTGIVNVFGGTLNAFQMFLGENGSGHGTLNISGGSANLGQTTFANADSVTGTINLNGGTITGVGFTANNGGGTGEGLFFFNGGTLIAGAANTNFIGAKVTSVVSTGGAKISSGTSAVTISSALTHDSTLSGADGGLTVSGASTLTLTGADTYNGGTKVTAGTLVIGTSVAFPTNTSVSVTGGSLQFASGIGLNTLSSLTISGGGLVDVTNNHLIVNYTSSDPASTIRGYLATGYNGGHWNGPGIDSSTAAVTPGYGVGFADGADHVAPGLSSGQIEVKYTLYGDVNLDGSVNGTDFGILAANFGKNVTSGWEAADFNYDGKVNASDFGLLAANFGKSASGTAIALPASDWAALDAFAAANGLLADVPEPASISLLAVGGLCMLRRRRRV